MNQNIFLMEYCNNYDFINYLLDEKIYDLLKSIHQHYPNLFKKEYINKELKIIIKNIKLFNLDNKKIINNYIKNSNNKKKSVKNNKILVNKKKNTNLFNKNINNFKLKKDCKLIKYDNITTKRNNIINSKYNNNIDRCQGRVWGDTIINNKSIIYGNQCKNKKSKNSDYCFIHQNKLSHGNYFTEPNIMIKNHFEKNSKKIIIK